MDSAMRTTIALLLSTLGLASLGCSGPITTRTTPEIDSVKAECQEQGDRLHAKIRIPLTNDPHEVKVVPDAGRIHDAAYEVSGRTLFVEFSLDRKDLGVALPTPCPFTVRIDGADYRLDVYLRSGTSRVIAAVVDVSLRFVPIR
jgi:hypothetical protein